WPMDVIFTEGVNEQIARQMIAQKNIPCVCRIGEQFELLFQEPLPEIAGVVPEWNKRRLWQLVAPGGGGIYTYFHPALVTLACEEGPRYLVIELSLFDRNVGWQRVILNGEYVEPVFVEDDHS
ncbi:MAG: hypothetical protein JO002_10390, partial [Burkholderiaceae bacterium]|nr:hypothetical protein [Burkholderiaceae bacterium]